jgi:hypothetical protein
MIERGLPGGMVERGGGRREEPVATRAGSTWKVKGARKGTKPVKKP